MSASRQGYLASVLGALGGGALSAAAAVLVGPAAFHYGLAHFQVRPNKTGNGLEDGLAGIGAAIATGWLAIVAAVMLVALCVWFGSVLGCGLGLRVADHDYARRTALTFGSVLPLIFILLALAIGRFARMGLGAVYVLYLVSVGLTAYLARRFTLPRR